MRICIKNCMDSTVLFTGKASVKKLPVVEAKIGQPSQAKWFLLIPTEARLLNLKHRREDTHQTQTAKISFVKSGTNSLP